MQILTRSDYANIQTKWTEDKFYVTCDTRTLFSLHNNDLVKLFLGKVLRLTRNLRMRTMIAIKK